MTIHFKENCKFNYKIGVSHKKKEKLEIKLEKENIPYNELINFFSSRNSLYPVRVINHYLEDYVSHHGKERQFVIGENETHETILFLTLTDFSDNH